MNQLGMFAKHWKAGHVKTRLAASIGAAAAAEMYQAFVSTLLTRCSEVEVHRVLAYAPSDCQGEFEQVAGSAWCLQAQADGDLGHRMHVFFEHAFTAGYQRVVLIGSDSPNVPLAFIRQAFDALTRHAVVVGPSEDGGYYLIGAACQPPPVFTDMAWSTPDVFEQTRQRLEDTKTSYAILPSWYDVDDARTLRQLSADLRKVTDDDALLRLYRGIQQSLDRSVI